MRYHKITDESVQRLSIYLRRPLFLSTGGQESISSRDLEDFPDGPWQVRKDFFYFGDFGTHGLGNLSLVVLAYQGFKICGFDIAVTFDADSKKICRKISNILIESASNFRTLERRK